MKNDFKLIHGTKKCAKVTVAQLMVITFNFYPKKLFSFGGNIKGTSIRNTQSQIVMYQGR